MMHGWMQDSQRTTRWVVAIILAAVAIPFLYLSVGIVSDTVQQLSWRPSHAQRLNVTDVSYSERGIILGLHAPAGVGEMWKPRRGLCQPWLPSYQRVTFRVLESENEGQPMVLVYYDFSPGREWGVTIKSRDGYWYHTSPYFPDEPDTTDEEWNQFVKSSRLVVPDG